MSQTRIWKQDPSVADIIGTRLSFLPDPVQDGPKDADVVVQGMPFVNGDDKRNFLFNPVKDQDNFRSVNSFTTVKEVLIMYRRALNRLYHNGNDLTWNWGSSPISVHPLAGDMRNAYYDRQQRGLFFFYFTAEGKKIYTCDSFDIISHETGHAILDSLQPGYLQPSTTPETAALHEAFGDLTSLFMMMSQLDQCEAIVAKTKANLDKDSFFSLLAEQFGEAVNHDVGLRNAHNDLTMGQLGSDDEPHDLSKVFTGAVYSILSEFYREAIDYEIQDPAMTLFETGQYVCSLTIVSLIRSPPTNVSYGDVANQMINLEKDGTRKRIIRDEFERREILGPKATRMVTAAARRAPKRTKKPCTCSTLNQLK